MILSTSMTLSPIPVSYTHLDVYKRQYWFSCCLSLAYIVIFNLSCYNKNNQLLGNKGAFSVKFFPHCIIWFRSKRWIYWAGAAILALILLIILIVCFSFCHREPSVTPERPYVDEIGGVPLYTQSVSYTHLDVYKRQPSHG